MKDLADRLAALDPEASAALRVIAHFDQLIRTRVGLPTIVREAAMLAGHPARLVDERRHLSVRAGPDGTARPPTGPTDPQWLSEPLPGEGTARLWLERQGPASPVEAMVLERAAAAAATVLSRTRGTASRSHTGDPACVELVLDAAVPRADRLRAARELGVPPTGLARAVAVHGAPPHVEPETAPSPTPVHNQRAGVGPLVAVLDLPASWAYARIALRFTAEGTPSDPGPRTVRYEELGGLALLATAVRAGTEPVPDVRALMEMAATSPWALATLTAIVENGSLRAAASALRVHHSTLQDRLSSIEHQLGWSVREPQGRLRLHLALALRRLHRNADMRP